MGERANLFGDTEFDVSDFSAAKPAAAAPPAAVREVAERADFSSREPEKKRRRRPARIHTTGRNAQFSCKADPDVVDELYAIADSQNWVMGEALEHAVTALKRELAGQG